MGMKYLREVIRDRLQTELRLWFPFRAAEVTHQDGPPSVLDDLPDRRKRFDDAIIIRDMLMFVQRNVEIDPYEHAFAFQVDRINGQSFHGRILK